MRLLREMECQNKYTTWEGLCLVGYPDNGIATLSQSRATKFFLKLRLTLYKLYAVPMSHIISTLYNVCSTVGVPSTMGMLSTMGGYHDKCGGNILSTVGCSVPWGDIMSTMGGYHEYRGGVQYRGGYHPLKFEYHGGISWVPWGYLEYHGVFSSVGGYHEYPN